MYSSTTFLRFHHPWSFLSLKVVGGAEVAGHGAALPSRSHDTLKSEIQICESITVPPQPTLNPRVPPMKPKLPLWPAHIIYFPAGMSTLSPLPTSLPSKPKNGGVVIQNPSPKHKLTSHFIHPDRARATYPLSADGSQLHPGRGNSGTTFPRSPVDRGFYSVWAGYAP